MAEEHANATSLDTMFLKSKRGLLKTAEMATLLVAFVCFSVASRPKFITATVLELVVTATLLTLYALKLNRRLSFFFWPFVDVFNSAFAAVYLLVLSLVAVTTYTVTGTLAGGIVGFAAAVVFGADCFVLSRNITLNKPRSETQANQVHE